jgi:hypothetical protein
MQSWFQPFVEFLSTLGNSMDWLLNLIAVILYFTSMFLFVRGWWRYRRLRRLREVKPAEGAIAVAIGVGMDISHDARQFLEITFGLDEQKQLKVPLLLTYSKSGFLSREEIIDVIRDVRNRLRELMVVGGVSEVHLFYGGPVGVAAALGAIADNWVPVKWYTHNKKTGKYEYLFTLDVEMVKGL